MKVAMKNSVINVKQQKKNKRIRGDTGSSADSFNENFDDSKVKNIIHVKTEDRLKL